MNTIQELLSLEKQIKAMINQIKKDIIHNVQDCHINNVTQISNNIAVVKLSNLSVWTPMYYIANAQAEIIKRKLEQCNTVKALTTCINDIIVDKKVKIGDSNYHINDDIITILKDYIKEDN